MTYVAVIARPARLSTTSHVPDSFFSRSKATPDSSRWASDGVAASRHNRAKLVTYLIFASAGESGTRGVHSPMTLCHGAIAAPRVGGWCNHGLRMRTDGTQVRGSRKDRRQRLLGALERPAASCQTTQTARLHENLSTVSC